MAIVQIKMFTGVLRHVDQWPHRCSQRLSILNEGSSHNLLVHQHREVRVRIMRSVFRQVGRPALERGGYSGRELGGRVDFVGACDFGNSSGQLHGLGKRRCNRWGWLVALLDLGRRGDSVEEASVSARSSLLSARCQRTRVPSSAAAKAGTALTG